MTKFLSIGFIVLLAFTLNAQDYKSVHQSDYEKYGSKVKIAGEKEITGAEIIPLRLSKIKTQKAVFGYLPDWEYQTARNYLRYDLLTHISAFDFVVSATGSISNPSYWPWTDVINAAHTNGVKVILTAVCFDTNSIRNLLTNATVKQTFFNNLLTKINAYSLDGVNIDFEGMSTWLRGTLMNTFMQDLTTFIHTNIPGAEVSFAGPAVNWSGWQLAGLAAACDYIFIMGYDFYGSWSTTTGPSAPLTGGSYNITNTVNTQYSAVTNSNPEKLILGCPYFGNKYLAKTSAAHSSVYDHISTTRVRDDLPNSLIYGRLWAADNQVAWYRWQNNDTSWYQVWFDSDSSMALKFNLAKTKNLKGIGMWALGYDGTRSEMWYLIQSSILPVELKSFTASQSGADVILQWKTSTETNNFQFELYRVKDEQEVLISVVPGAGNSSTEHDYSFVDENILPGKYKYRLFQMDTNGKKKLAGELDLDVINKMNFMISQNYPNPFNPSTNLDFSVSLKSNVKIEIFNITGEKVKTLINNVVSEGNYSLTWTGENDYGNKVPSGIYYCRMSAADFVKTIKMTVIK